MKTVKLLLLIFIMGLIPYSIFAQTGAAKMALDAGTLDKAKEKIDAAMKDEKEVAKARFWLVRAQVYAGIAGDLSGLYTKLSDNPVQIAYDSYQKAMEMDFDKEKNKKGTVYKEAEKDLAERFHGIVINYGAARYQDDDPKAAVDAFVLAQTTNPKDTIPFMYAAQLAYENQRYDIFEQSILKVFDMNINNKVLYYTLYTYYLLKEKDNKEKALEIGQKGLKLDPAKDPESYKQLQSMVFQLYLDLDKTDEAIAEIESSIQSSSSVDEKSILYFNLGVLYERKEQTEKAMEAYEKSIGVKPNYDATFNLGAMHFNKAVEIKKETDNMSLDEYNKRGKAIEEEAKVYFKKALPYFEKVYEMPEGKSSRVIGTLAQIYRILGNDAKAKKLTDELDAMEDN